MGAPEGNKYALRHGHGDPRARSITYNSWRAMCDRCNQPTHKWYHRYGQRGITVCPEWQGRGGFQRFLADMGERPNKDYTLDRIRNAEGYCKDNCKWSTKSEQNRNRG